MMKRVYIAVRPRCTTVPRSSMHSGRLDCVCVVGVGYVGETLLQQFSRIYETIGYDTSIERIESLRSKYSGNTRVQLTADPEYLRKATHFLIAVPTPLETDHSVNLSFVTSAVDQVIELAQPGSSIVIESSVPIGTTRQLLGHHQASFRCGMSPERIDPGRAQPCVEKIPKIVSGLTPPALKQIMALYSKVYDAIVPVSKPEVAEMVKLHENCYRMVNIAYANEISDACLSHSIDPREMIGAASTKPFGFQPFVPGLGVGGHCLPVNPWYLFHNNPKLPVLRLATRLMAERPRMKARSFYRKCRVRLCSRMGAAGSAPRILIIGLGFKSGQSNIAHSPALEFAKALKELGCQKLAFYDPTINSAQAPWIEKLDDLSWTSSYIDEMFDAVACCNYVASIDRGVLEHMRKVLIRSFVW